MEKFDLDQPMIQFGDQHSAFSIRHAVEGIQIFGGIGSGKTSGSGRMLALKYLRAGFGGLVLTVKPDEKDSWQEYCIITGREKDLLVVEPGSRHYFNFLEYEVSKSSEKQGLTENLADLLKTVIRAGEQQDSGKSDDAFWESALDMLIFNVIDLCKLAYGKLDIELIYEIVQSIPKSTETKEKPESDEPGAFKKAIQLAHQNTTAKITEWQKTLSPELIKRYKSDQALFLKALDEAVPDSRLYRYVRQFFLENFKNLSEKTRSIIDFIFSGFLFKLMREPVFSLFCNRPYTFTPEDSLNGKIILINLPVKTYHKIDRDSQILFKYIWQRAMEARNIKENERPVFLYADEAQNFLHEHDADFQATARSSRISTVYITQNLPNYYASMGGDKAEYRVKSFLGTLATKIFHANADIETNKYASELIGDTDKTNPSFQVSVGKDSFSQSKTIGIINERRVKPEQFVSLKTGGPLNNYMVEGYLHRQGDALFQNQNYTKTTFNQLRT